MGIRWRPSLPVAIAVTRSPRRVRVPRPALEPGRIVKLGSHDELLKHHELELSTMCGLTTSKHPLEPLVMPYVLDDAGNVVTEAEGLATSVGMA